jgi:hypothetical protein
MRFILTFALTALMNGCVPVTSNGVRHTLVLGFGVVSTPAIEKPAAQITKTKAIGLVLSDQPGMKAGIGYASSTVTQVRTNQNLIVDVSAVKIETK